MSHTHWPDDKLPGGQPAPVCRFATKKACEEAVRQWEDDRFVALAARGATEHLKYHKDRSPDANMYSQVVQVLAGVRDELTAKGGHANQSPQAKRLRVAIDRYRAENPVQ